MDFDRVRLRRQVYEELRKVRGYRQALRKDVEDDYERLRMQAWVRVADDLLAITRAEPDGDRKARFVDELYGLTRRSPGSVRFVFSRTVAAIAGGVAGAYYGVPDEIRMQALQHLDPFLRDAFLGAERKLKGLNDGYA